MDAHDSVESHIADTVVAGAFLCKLPAVEVRAAPPGCLSTCGAPLAS